MKEKSVDSSEVPFVGFPSCVFVNLKNIGIHIVILCRKNGQINRILFGGKKIALKAQKIHNDNEHALRNTNLSVDHVCGTQYLKRDCSNPESSVASPLRAVHCAESLSVPRFRALVIHSVKVFMNNERDFIVVWKRFPCCWELSPNRQLSLSQ